MHEIIAGEYPSRATDQVVYIPLRVKNCQVYFSIEKKLIVFKELNFCGYLFMKYIHIFFQIRSWLTTIRY
jgi:hypothetical protein